MQQLTKKTIKFKWTTGCQESFEELKALLTLDKILANYNLVRATTLYVDDDPMINHEPLIALYKSHSLELPFRVAKHESKLDGFDFNLVYKPSTTTPADYVSQHPIQYIYRMQESVLSWV